MNDTDQKTMDSLSVAVILDLISSCTDDQWVLIQHTEIARRKLLNPSFTTYGPDGKVAYAPPIVPPSTTYVTVGKRIKFSDSTRPYRIAGCTGVVTGLLAKGNVKVRIDGTHEVFTRVPRVMYDIVTHDTVIPATKSAQRRYT